MPIVDPNKSGGGFRSCGKGDKVLACVGLSRRPNQKGNQQYEVHYVCVKDLSAPAGEDGDKGADHWDRFVLVDTALFRIGQAAKAFGHTQPFDTDDKNAVSEIFSKGYVIAHVTSRVWEGEEKFETKNWRPYTGPEEEDWADLIAKGEKDHAKLVASRKNGAGGSGSGSGGSGAAQRPARRKESDDPTADFDDSEVPF